MNPRLRVALAAVPILSLGLLSWLPFVWFMASRPKGEHPYANAVFWSGLGTAAWVVMVVLGEPGSALRTFGAVMALAHIAAGSTLAWVHASHIMNPPKDPYA